VPGAYYPSSSVPGGYGSTTITSVITKPTHYTKCETHDGTTETYTYPTTSYETKTIVTSYPGGGHNGGYPAGGHPGSPSNPGQCHCPEAPVCPGQGTVTVTKDHYVTVTVGGGHGGPTGYPEPSASYSVITDYFPSASSAIVYPSGSSIVVYPSGSSAIAYPSGSSIADGFSSSAPVYYGSTSSAAAPGGYTSAAAGYPQ